MGGKRKVPDASSVELGDGAIVGWPVGGRLAVSPFPGWDWQAATASSRTAAKGVIDFAFGPGSRLAHRAAAEAAGASYHEVGGPLTVDLDTPEDLVFVEAAEAAGAAEAGGAAQAAEAAEAERLGVR